MYKSKRSQCKPSRGSLQKIPLTRPGTGLSKKSNKKRAINSKTKRHIKTSSSLASITSPHLTHQLPITTYISTHTPIITPFIIKNALLLQPNPKSISHPITTTIRSIHTNTQLSPLNIPIQSIYKLLSIHSRQTLPFSTIKTPPIITPITPITPTPSPPSSSSDQLSKSLQMSTTDLNEFICIDAFCARQFTKGCESGFIDHNQEKFLEQVIKLLNERIKSGEDLDNNILIDGYAPFCKHIFIKNFTTTTPTAIEITPELEPFIKTAYVARTENELPVLSRFINSIDVPEDMKKTAKYLDLILYSREQIKIENDAMGTINNDTSKWGIISIKSQDQSFETPMQPITMLRNALGKDQGGSGVPLDKTKYKASVDFWEKNISLL